MSEDNEINILDSKGAKRGWRDTFFKWIWLFLYPLRFYINNFPVQRGKGIILRYVITPLLPSGNSEFSLTVPGDVLVSLRYRETLGLSSLLYGPFEKAELQFVNEYLKPGEVGMDIGANVGIFSVVMAAKVGSGGQVFSVEPLASNVRRLENNLEKNSLKNTRIFNCALGEADGEMMLHMATDSAYPSLMEVQEGLGDGTAVPVEVRTLDGLWGELGQPCVAFVKMDVEGAEAGVLRGASAFLSTCQPTLLLEANSDEHFEILREILVPYGYRHVRPEGFVVHNHIFMCPARHAPSFQ